MCEMGLKHLTGLSYFLPILFAPLPARRKAQRGGHLPKVTKLMHGEASPWGLELGPSACIWGRSGHILFSGLPLKKLPTSKGLQSPISFSQPRGPAGAWDDGMV